MVELAFKLLDQFSALIAKIVAVLFDASFVVWTSPWVY